MKRNAPMLHSWSLPMSKPLLGMMWRLLGAIVAVLCGAGAALAQSAAEPDIVDPPGRVGSVTLLAGPVTMIDLATGSREEALLNWPVTGGWRIDTGNGGRAEVRIGSTALRLDDDTTVDFARLDDQFIQIAVLRGSVSLRLRNPEILDEIEVLTQRERMAFEDVGRYRIDVDRAPGLTAVTTFFGRARIGIGGSTFVVAGGQRGELAASPMVSFAITGAAADRFDDWAAARDAREESVRSAAYVSRETTGVELLDEFGDWRTVAEHGPVWFPRGVATTWAPYRFGRWAWVSPWGWTWIDEAPWGFAPLHYGRWAVVGGAWGWVPGIVVPRPIFAPALVAWFGTPGVSVTIGAPIGWFPLGPREVYVPAFRHTPRYLRVVNLQHAPNVDRVTIVQTPRYVNRHPDRSTWVADDRFGRPEPVHRGQRPPPSEWRQYIARPQPPVNVPDTKRRQASEGPLRPTPATTPAAPADTRPVVRPPLPAQRSAETPRAVEAPRPLPAPRAVDAPRALPPAAPALAPTGPSRGRGELPAGARDDRRMAPRAPTPATQQPSAPYTPPIERVAPPRRDITPAPAPGPQFPPSAVTPPPERARPRDVAPAPSMRQPSAPTPPPQLREAAPPRTPRAIDTPAPRGPTEPAAARDAIRQSPRGPAAPMTATPAGAAPSPPTAAASGRDSAHDAGRAAPARPGPPARQDGGPDRGGDRSGRGSYEAAR